MQPQILSFKNSSLVLGHDVLNSNVIQEACPTSKVVIVADDNVAKIYGEALRNRLQSSVHDVYLFTFPKGESSKTRETKQKIEDKMLENI